ncbi:hypothetical protein EYC80_007307 [Monilinia laxa]|uniref:Uncharacterized protein n=1 Tax=Monilinia laxa TaxID=61186 RepID=A0A5N6JVU7_MONLA|nr:hypothetical protein EYC80_007307 [Monilinia laxa]
MFHQTPLVALPSEAKGFSTPLPSYSPNAERRVLYVDPPVHISDINQVSLCSVRTFMIGDLPITETVYEIEADWDLQDNIDQESQTLSTATAIFNPQVEGNHRDLISNSLLMPVELFETEGDVNLRINSVIEVLSGMVVNEPSNPEQNSNGVDDDIGPPKISTECNLNPRYSSAQARADYGVEDSQLLLDRHQGIQTQNMIPPQKVTRNQMFRDKGGHKLGGRYLSG